MHATRGTGEKSLFDYLDMLIRRKKPFLLLSSLVLTITISLVFGLPAIYQSTATISIQQQEISEELVKSTITSYAEGHVQEISKRILTNTRLAEIIDKLKLYSDYRDDLPIDTIIGKMRDSIEFKMSSAMVKSQGAKKQPSISFTASFDYPKDPQIAQQVTMEIVDLFLEENKSDRKRRSEISYTFLLNELRRLEDEAVEVDLKLADFKKENIGKLPEQAELTLKVADRLERDIAEASRQLFDLRQQNIILRSDLMKISEYAESPELTNEFGERIMSVEGRVQALKSTYVNLLSEYLPEHPNLKSIQKEIISLGGDVSFSGEFNTVHQDLATKEKTLLELKSTLSPDHENIKHLEDEVASIKEKLSYLTDAPSITSPQYTRAINPAYLATTTQLKINDAAIQSLIGKKKSYKTRQEELENKLLSSPMVAMEYNKINRDYKVISERIENVRGKLITAEMSEKLELSQNAERFALVDPPLIPTYSYKPRKEAIFAVGSLLALGLGFLGAAFFEMLDKTIYSNRVMTQVTGLEPLTVIPYMEVQTNNKKGIGKVQKKQWILISVAIMLALLFSYVHFNLISLNEIWNIYLHQLQLIVF